MEFKVIGNKSTFKEPQPWVFKPVSSFRLKMIIIFSLIAMVCYICIGLFLFIISEDVHVEEDVLMYGTGFYIVLSIVVIFLLHFYYLSFEYQVHGTEIIIKKGLINKTENHIPFSNITNILLRTGPLDQVFGIGSIIIHTAGQKNNPFEQILLSGLKIYQEVGYFVLEQIKSFESFLTYMIDEKTKPKDLLSRETLVEFNSLIKDISTLFKDKY